MKRKVIVVGHGMVAHRFIEKLSSATDVEITVFGEEKYPAYDRVHLSSFFDTNSHEGLLLADPAAYAEKGIQLKTGVRVDSIDPAARTIVDSNGTSYPYDILVLATGSTPFVPPLPGRQKTGVFVYRTIDDVMAMRDFSKKATSAAVIGGGLLGLEAAKASLDMGLKTHVIEFAPRLMPRQIDEDGSSFLCDKIKSLGIELHLGAEVGEIHGDDSVCGVGLKSGEQLSVEMVIISAGIRPRDDLAKSCGLTVGERGGIAVDDSMRTSDPNIFAIGEAALHRGFVYGLVAPGYEMAAVAADAIVGGERQFTGYDLSTSLKLVGVDVASFGDPFGNKETKPIVFADRYSGVYKRLNLSADGRRLLGGILVGDASDYGMLTQFTSAGTVLPEDASALLLGGKSAKMPELAGTAEICKCNNVSKDTIVAAVTAGCTELGALKKQTCAGTGCCGCSPMVSEILNKTLKDLGQTVDMRLCEHFPHTRQELVHIIQIRQLKSFREVLSACGQGVGCEICKPAVASILASSWNDLILRDDVVQDTNDRFLANIQKGGTYSVIPRIPGGEITPERLIVIGQVAKKYNLYCKITGGQRIDLLGARVDQLPQIWEELIDAGFESGHAYGKALRTVKSCVGSTWCRFGVQDSTSFAIRIEERYKGIRAPHKLKSAVSGCIRECAEAQSKDFGLIATEKGWNLYVCGNGGARPQHAVLLASDISEDLAIKYLDRFIVYYIRTAERLTRTSVWFNSLEGGIDHLRSVIIDDSLGICAELEQQMELLVKNYKCEWNEVVSSPALRARFRPFVNTDETDETIRFEYERGQKKPAEPVGAGV